MHVSPVLALLAMLGGPAFAQQTALLDAPEARTAVASGADSADGGVILAQHPPPAIAPKLQAGDWLLIGAAAPIRYFDYRSTVECLSRRGCEEILLPQSLVNNRAGFATFEAGTVVANYFVYQALVRRRHGVMARVGQLINLGAVGGTVMHNYEVLPAPSSSR